VRPKVDPGNRRRLNVTRYHYDSHDQLRADLADFMAAYNFARRLKTLVVHRARTNGAKWSTPTPYEYICEYICKIWTSEPERFIADPIQQMQGLNR
jgi:hypothetical protein